MQGWRRNPKCCEKLRCLRIKSKNCDLLNAVDHSLPSVMVDYSAASEYYIMGATLEVRRTPELWGKRCIEHSTSISYVLIKLELFTVPYRSVSRADYSANLERVLFDRSGGRGHAAGT